MAGTPKMTRGPLSAGQRAAAGVAGDGQKLRALGLPAADLHAAQGEQVLARSETQVVRDVNRWHKKTHLRGQVAAQRAHPVQKLATLLFIDKRDELETDLEGQFFELEQVAQVGALRLGGLLFVGNGLNGQSNGGADGDAPRANNAPETERKASLGRPGMRHMAPETRLAR